MSDILPAFHAPYKAFEPAIDGPLAFAGSGATVLGRSTLGKRAWLGAFCVIRGDGNTIDIGDDFYLGAHATVHISHGVASTHVGDNVTAGAGCVIHACTVGDNCVIEDDVVILDGSTIGPGTIITAGSTVFPRSELLAGHVYSGSPAKPVAQIDEADLSRLREKLRDAASVPVRAEGYGETGALDCFVAPSARLAGKVTAGAEVGIWYGCTFDAGTHEIQIGDGTNVQDNTRITCENSDVVLAHDVTIGHNVTLTDCRVETQSLIGIGATLSPGTVVEEGVLLAAGSVTEPGQRLSAGQFWAGRPARAMGPMDARKQEMVASTLPHYRDYARTFRATAHAALPWGDDK